MLLAMGLQLKPGVDASNEFSRTGTERCNHWPFQMSAGAPRSFAQPHDRHTWDRKPPVQSVGLWCICII